MNCRIFAGPLALMLMALSLLVTGAAWSQGEDDDGIALLLKSWRWESEGGRSTVDFSTNALMLLDGKPVEYRLTRERIFFPGGGEPIAYRYEGLTDCLTLTFTDGAMTEYRRAMASVMTRRWDGTPIDNGGHLFGRFCQRMSLTSGDPMMRAFSINDDATFDISPRPTHAGIVETEGSVLGTALLWGDRIIFSFDDGVAVEAEVIAHDGYGGVAAFRYLGSVYLKGACPGEPGPDQVVPQPEPGLIVPRPQPQEVSPRPSPPPQTVAPAKPSAPEKGKSGKVGTRSFGKTRGKKSQEKSGSQRSQRGFTKETEKENSDI